MRCVIVCPAVSPQPNVLHPLSLMEWKKTSPLPPVRGLVINLGLQCVIVGQKVYGVRWEWDTEGDSVVVYDIARDFWDIHSWPSNCYAALTTYHSQLVLIGGQERASGRVTSRVLVWQKGEWRRSLPPMTMARRKASALSRGVYTIVAGGETSASFTTDIVELFDGHSWMTAQPLLMACASMSCILHDSVWYLCNRERQGCEVFRATVQSIVDSAQRRTQSPVWNRLTQAPHLNCR